MNIPKNVTMYVFPLNSNVSQVREFADAISEFSSPVQMVSLRESSFFRGAGSPL